MREDVLCSCYFQEEVNRQKTLFQGREVSFRKAQDVDLCSTPTPPPAAPVTTTTAPTRTSDSSTAVPKWLTIAGILKQVGRIRET